MHTDLSVALHAGRVLRDRSAVEHRRVGEDGQHLVILQ